jgi:hypothetical protein
MTAPSLAEQIVTCDSIAAIEPIVRAANAEAANSAEPAGPAGE